MHSRMELEQNNQQQGNKFQPKIIFKLSNFTRVIVTPPFK
jgi:hypothetical protein